MFSSCDRKQQVLQFFFYVKMLIPCEFGLFIMKTASQMQGVHSLFRQGAMGASSMLHSGLFTFVAQIKQLNHEQNMLIMKVPEMCRVVKNYLVSLSLLTLLISPFYAAVLARALK